MLCVPPIEGGISMTDGVDIPWGVEQKAETTRRARTPLPPCPCKLHSVVQLLCNRISNPDRVCQREIQTLSRTGYDRTKSLIVCSKISASQISQEQTYLRRFWILGVKTLFSSICNTRGPIRRLCVYRTEK